MVGDRGGLRRAQPARTSRDHARLRSIDHRRGTAFAPGELIEYLRAGWDLGHDTKTYVEAVHRLSDLGAVVTHTAHGDLARGLRCRVATRSIFLTVEGDMVNRSEIFDEADLDAAIAKFEQLSRPAPRLENAASQRLTRFLAYFAARDWDAMAEILADDLFNDDRRRVVERGNPRWSRRPDGERAGGRRAVVRKRDVGASSRPAGGTIFLARVTFSGDDEAVEAFLADMLIVVEIDPDEPIAAIILFDLDDFDAAIAELDARYLAGEAAAHSRLGR